MNRNLSKPPKDVRYGNHGSLSVDLTVGRFFDHENNVGGGVLDLVRIISAATIAVQSHGCGAKALSQAGNVPTRLIVADSSAQGGRGEDRAADHGRL